MIDTQGKVVHRIVEASAHLIIGAGIQAKANTVAGAAVNMDLTVDQYATPKELEGLTIIVTGENAGEFISRIAQAMKAINDPDIDPEERQVLIEAIKAFTKKEPEGGGE